MLAANGGLGPGYRRAVVADKSVMWIAPTERGAASNEPRKRCVALCQSAAAATRHVASRCAPPVGFRTCAKNGAFNAARRACRNSPLFVWVLRVRAYPKCSSRRSARHAVRLLARAGWHLVARGGSQGGRLADRKTEWRATQRICTEAFASPRALAPVAWPHWHVLFSLAARGRDGQRPLGGAVIGDEGSVLRVSAGAVCDT